MDGEAPSREVLKKMYQHLIEIADVFGNPATASCAPPSTLAFPLIMVNTGETRLSHFDLSQRLLCQSLYVKNIFVKNFYVKNITVRNF